MVMRLDYDNTKSRGDLAREGGNLLTGAELRAAVILSLFCDARARETDERQIDQQRGFWGDAFAYIQGDQWGSRLWTLKRRNATARTIAAAREYAAEALQWLVDDGNAAEIFVESEFIGPKTIGLAVRISRPEKLGQWQDLWAGEIEL